MNLGKSLVLTHPARLGDSVLSLPLHRALAGRAELQSNVGEPFRFLFDLTGIRAGSAGALYPKGTAAVIRTARELRRRQYGSVFLVRPNFRSALMARLGGIQIRVGDPTEGRGWLLTHCIKLPPCTNQLDRLRAFGAAVGVDVVDNFGLPCAERKRFSVGVMPGASYSDKLIPAGALLQVCRRLVDRGYSLVLLGGPGQDSAIGEIADLPAENWIGRYSLPDLVLPLSSLSAMIGPDGGLYHLSVACGVPSVGVYGPTARKCWWHAWGSHVPVLAPQGLMANVTADMIWEATAKVLGIELD